ncbi:nitronate monooxygenase family protein [Ideonella sp. B508-1]|uniref:NAD(P)H-dependent flavin oxidoreductase n=1 Tax=Ideonella sp. B508-1 TaxID=137716 RepID=UPI000349E4BA|nr:nitronate monooxygenase [Ideonella sp. B508-1]
MKTRVTELLGIRYPIVQSGMRWLSRAELVAAVSQAGGFGLLSAHTLPDAEALREEIRRTRRLTGKPFGVNLTLLAANAGIDVPGYVRVVCEERVQAVETSGSSPAPYLEALQGAGVKVIHKATSVRHALKAESLGVDAVIIDGFECAGHPGQDDVPGLVLIPAATRALKVPVLAAGGFADARGLVAALALGADAVCMGTRFMLTQESPLHPALKERMLAASETDTTLVGRRFGDSIRVMKNARVAEALVLESQPATTHHDLMPLIGAPRWMRAMETGDAEDSALPVGQCVGLIDDLPTCAEFVERLMGEARGLITDRLARLAQAD